MSLFTVPKFLAMPAVGLDISADAVRFIELEEKGGILRVARHASRNFPLSIISEGQVQDKKRVQDVIASLAYEYKLSFANVSLPERNRRILQIFVFLAFRRLKSMTLSN